MITNNDSRIRFIDARVILTFIILNNLIYRMENNYIRSKHIKMKVFQLRQAYQMIFHMSSVAQKMEIYTYGAKYKAQLYRWVKQV